MHTVYVLMIHIPFESETAANQCKCLAPTVFIEFVYFILEDEVPVSRNAAYQMVKVQPRPQLQPHIQGTPNYENVQSEFQY